MPSSSFAEAISRYGDSMTGALVVLDPVGTQEAASKNYVDRTSQAGSKLIVFGHSYAAGGGATPITRSWVGMLGGMLRARVWQQSVGGAVLAKTPSALATSGAGGIASVMQGAVPNPTPIVWRGPYNAATVYYGGDGVSSGGNWYVLSQATLGVTQTGTAPPGGAWIQIPAVGSSPGILTASAYEGAAHVPVLWYGNNDIGNVYQHNPQPFLTAMETALAWLSCADVFDSAHAMVVLAGGTWTNTNGWPFGVYGGGNNYNTVPNTAGATATFGVPADYPGGYVDFFFMVDKTIGAGNLLTGKLAFTVDGASVNVVTSGKTDTTNVVDFGAVNRAHIDTAHLTTALTAGVAVTTLAVSALPYAVASGDLILVGAAGASDTFTASAAAAAGATSITVTSLAPTFAHPVNDDLSDISAANWRFLNNMVVRVPVTAGAHTVVATVQTGTAVSGMNFNAVGLEAAVSPAIAVLGLTYMPTLSWWPGQFYDADIDTWNTALKALLASEFPNAVYVDMANAVRTGAQLTTALTAGQAGITALQVQALPYAIASGDTISVGSGNQTDYCTASAAAAAGATTIAVTSFTSTYAHGVGQWVWDRNVLAKRYNYDGLHPNDYGQGIIAQAVYQAMPKLSLSTSQVAAQAHQTGRIAVRGIINSGNTTVNPGAVANTWAALSPVPQILIPADPGDEIELSFQAIWDVPAAASSGMLDIQVLGAGGVTRWVSGVMQPYSQLPGTVGATNVGAQNTNGLPALFNPGLITANDFRPVYGRWRYPVQPDDIVQGQVKFQVWGKTSAAASRLLLSAGPANQLQFSAENAGPMSYNGEAA